MKKLVTLITDGACHGNPGIGGWGFVLRYGSRVKMRSGRVERTTNNRTELMAVLEGLRSLRYGVRVHLISDSQYVLNGMEHWMCKWKTRGWRSKNREVANRDLWEQIDAQMQFHELTYEWVRGHNGHPDNELCDQLATQAIRGKVIS